ncbi:hypothetical protein ABTZ21_34670 [Streptomyces sp. NPDC096191]|uniref:hypothetical protein n=1 Tax=Streptomyces sp. NPDC096191 TaxID=3155426 RepID=UPI00331CACC9
MPRRPQPSRITVGEVEAVALPVAEYEQLLASRRQMGGQSARIRALSDRLRRTEQVLDDLEGLIAATGDEAAGLRRAVAELLRRHRGTSS